MCGTDCFLMLLSVLFPPIGVWVKRGVCSADGLINLALCCLGFLPGLLHAWYIIFKYPDTDEYEQLADGGERARDGTVTYYYVSHTGPAPRAGIQRGRGQQSYGTVGSQPSGRQFPGQQSGVTNSFAQPNNKAAGKPNAPQGPVDEGQGEGSSQPAGPPPTYADAVKGDHKVQNP